MAAQHESLKQIADYLKDIKDKTWTINVTVQPAQVVIQTIDLAEFKQALIDALSGLNVTVNPQITLEAGASGGCGGDCGGTCGDLMCVIAPAAAAIVQMGKSINNMAKNPYDPFPSPDDYDPPQILTPYPDGGTVPPGYTYPPGGMNGGGDLTAYNAYKCDISWYLVDYLIYYYEGIVAKAELAASVTELLSLLKELEGIWAEIRAFLAVDVMKVSLEASAEAGVSLLKVGTKTSLKAVVALIGLIIEALDQTLGLFVPRLQLHINMLKSRRKAMVCALLNGETAPDAVSRLNRAAGKFVTPGILVGISYDAYWGPLNTAILGSLPQNLFACEAGYDFTAIEGYSTIYGEGCEGCDFSCDGATTIIDFDLGKQGWFTLNPPVPDTSYGEIMGLGMNGDPDPELSLGVSGFKQAKSVRIESTKSFTFTQVCVKYGGQAAAGNHTVLVYVGGILAMSKVANIDNTKHYEVVTLNIEEDKVESYPNENLLNNKFHGTVSVERNIPGGNAAGGQGRIFAVAFGEMGL